MLQFKRLHAPCSTKLHAPRLGCVEVGWPGLLLQEKAAAAEKARRAAEANLEALKSQAGGLEKEYDRWGGDFQGQGQGHGQRSEEQRLNSSHRN